MYIFTDCTACNSGQYMEATCSGSGTTDEVTCKGNFYTCSDAKRVMFSKENLENCT